MMLNLRRRLRFEAYISLLVLLLLLLLLLSCKQGDCIIVVPEPSNTGNRISYNLSRNKCCVPGCLYT